MIMKNMNCINKLLFFPSFAGFILFYVLPFWFSIRYAFLENAFTKKFVGFENFRGIINNEYFLLAAKNTVFFSILGVSLLMIVSIFIATLCVKYFPTLTLIKSVFFLPYILPSAVITTIANNFLTLINPFPMLIVIYIWKYSGLCIMIIITSLAGANKYLLEAAKIDGANTLKQLLYITLPSIRSSLFFVLIISIVNSLKIHRESYLLYGNYPHKSVYMLGNYFSNHFTKLNYQNISTAAVIFSFMLYLIIAWIYHKEKREDDEIW